MRSETTCPHPARRGSHEAYTRPNGSTFCRACGEELTPPGALPAEIWIETIKGAIPAFPAWADHPEEVTPANRIAGGLGSTDDCERYVRGDAILEALEDQVLGAMMQGPHFDGEPTATAFSFRCLEERAGLPREIVRALCRQLTDDGLACYARGLWTEDGEPFGAGYGITRKGIERLERKGKV